MGRKASAGLLPTKNEAGRPRPPTAGNSINEGGANGREMARHLHRAGTAVAAVLGQSISAVSLLLIASPLVLCSRTSRVC